MGKFEVAVVGAGILGLSCALAAARRGRKVVVIERDPRAQKASVRNFGFITVTGQDREGVWERARRTRDVWAEVCPAAGIEVTQRGQWVAAQRAEAAAVLDAFMQTDMAEGCKLLTPAEAYRRCPDLRTAGLHGVLWSPHELRVESRQAIPLLAQWLAAELGVTFMWGAAVQLVQPGRLETTGGAVQAEAVVVCPGDDFVSLFADRLSKTDIRRCTLQMMRLESPGFQLPGTVMSDQSLVRYGGFARLAEAGALRGQLEREQGEFLQHGIHLIVAQGADGSLVVGDSHHYDVAEDPFATERIYELLLQEYGAVFGRPAPAVRQRWIGTYASASDRVLLIEAPAATVRLVMVTSGIGVSTGFAIGEEVIGELCG
jgi:FAD dependent oxidoreductase TIGR03364